ncbi:hypothetical protein QUB61_01660 [Microcoleus sp. C2D2]
MSVRCPSEEGRRKKESTTQIRTRIHGLIIERQTDVEVISYLLVATNPQCPMPNSQFPMPNSQFPIPNSQFPIPNY